MFEESGLALMDKKSRATSLKFPHSVHVKREIETLLTRTGLGEMPRDLRGLVAAVALALCATALAATHVQQGFGSPAATRGYAPGAGGNFVFDSLNCRSVGTWPLGNCSAIALDTARHRLFASSGGAVLTVDISDPTAPRIVSDRLRTQGLVDDLVYDPSLSRLYIAGGELTLEIWDVSIDSTPVRLGGYTDTGRGLALAVAGDYAYIAAGSSGLLIVDISDPSNPYLTARASTSLSYLDACVYGHYVLAAEGGAGFRVIDVEDPYNPQFVGWLDTYRAEGVAIEGGIAYVADSDSGLRVVDVSDPTAPVELGHWLGYAHQLAILGQAAYVADGFTALRIVNVAEPANPWESGHCDLPGLPFRVELVGNLAYVADYQGGLCVVDVADSANPVQVARCRVPGWSYALAVKQDHAFMATQDAGINVVSLDDPTWPRLVMSCSTFSSAQDIVVRNQCAYLAMDNVGLSIADITNPEEPQPVGRCSTARFAWRVAVAGHHAYLIDHWYGLHVFDISDSSQPQEVGIYPMHQADGIAVADTVCFVARMDSGLTFINVADPAHPRLIYRAMSRLARDVVLFRNYACYCDGYHVRILDVSDPENPVEVGSCAIPSPSEGLAILGQYLYVCELDGGFRMIDLSDPSQPTEAGYYARYGLGADIAAQGQFVYVVDEFRGLQVYENLLPVAVDEAGEPNVCRSSVSVLGNPMIGGDLRLKFEPSADGPVRIRVFDAAGRLRATKSFDINGGVRELRMTLQGITSGVYFLHILAPGLDEHVGISAVQK